jgi:hypothetical protein
MVRSCIALLDLKWGRVWLTFADPRNDSARGCVALMEGKAKGKIKRRRRAGERGRGIEN